MPGQSKLQDPEMVPQAEPIVEGSKAILPTIKWAVHRSVPSGTSPVNPAHFSTGAASAGAGAGVGGGVAAGVAAGAGSVEAGGDRGCTPSVKA